MPVRSAEFTYKTVVKDTQLSTQNTVVKNPKPTPSRKWTDVRDELFGPIGTKRRTDYEKYVKKVHQRVARAKKKGDWPKEGEIYWNELEEELHLIRDCSKSLIWTEYGNKHIEMCGQMGPLPEYYKLIGTL